MQLVRLANAGADQQTHTSSVLQVCKALTPVHWELPATRFDSASRAETVASIFAVAAVSISVTFSLRTAASFSNANCFQASISLSVPSSMTTSMTWFW
eukprot:TRINITY_DN5001_c0_g1_i1.p1 TRINITY_DN5001_c0_g1~~TRINITY_DN5001_c0_g1_i1.p1  ORF type:complete len:108 (+),score=11.12 TRINITY_DN5001_c0_g1_i1:33-326(+)